MGWRHLLACLSCKMLNVKYEISGQLLICSNTGGRLHLMHHWKRQPFSSHFSASFLQKTPFVCTYLTPYWLPISTFLCLVLSWPFQSPVLKLYFISLSWIAMLCMIWGSEKKRKKGDISLMHDKQAVQIKSRKIHWLSVQQWNLLLTSMAWNRKMCGKWLNILLTTPKT